MFDDSLIPGLIADAHVAKWADRRRKLDIRNFRLF